MGRPVVIVANRAYLDHLSPPGNDHGAGLPAGGGGLLAALRPAIDPWDGECGTTWIGAGRGPHDRAFVDRHGYEFIETPAGPLRHRRLFFTRQAWTHHYSVVANGFLWPLLHLVRPQLLDRAICFPPPALPSQEAWASFRAVNQAFAKAALAEGPGRSIWVHDYQLVLVPAAWREQREPGQCLGFFLHTPVPDPQAVAAMLDPTVRTLLTEVVNGMLGADIVGFQTVRDLSRFRALALDLGLASDASGGLRVPSGRVVALTVAPVGMEAAEVTRALDGTPPPPGARPRVVSIERCDITKGIPERFRAATAALSGGVRFDHTSLLGPVRRGVAAGAALRDAVDREQAAFAAAAAAARVSFRSRATNAPWTEVVKAEAGASVIFTASLADGMNMVALQGIAAQAGRPLAERAVVLAGKDAGVSHAYAGLENDGLVPVDPLDHDALSETLVRAIRGELPRVSDALIARVRANSARRWARNFLDALEAAPC